MAGAGYKLFQTGDVLTAAQVNTYLNEQTVMVFANAAARTSALTSVLAEGMMSYLQDTNSVEVYNGSAWVGFTGDITEVQAGVGISIASGTGPIPVITNSSTDLITTAGDILYGTAADTVARLGIGTAGQVLKVNSGATAPEWGAASSGALTLIKTAAFSSVADTGTTFNTVFSSTYEYYILQLSVKGSTTANLLFQIRSGSTTRTANYYGSSAVVAPSSSTLTNSGSNGTSSWDLMDIGSAFESIASLTLNYRQTTLPFISGTFNSIISNQTGFCGLLVDNGSFDGFILSASTGNITGSVSVYGLAKS